MLIQYLYFQFWLTFLLNFYFEGTFDIIKNLVGQPVLIIWIQSFIMLHVTTKMHDYKIKYY